MPIGAQDSLQKLYDRQNLLSDEATRREVERDQLEESDERNSDRYYILEIEIAALRQESSRISARIGDLLERDLQR
jgi:predicted  nucleic acid-binding Zn-ribbon protein